MLRTWPRSSSRMTRHSMGKLPLRAALIYSKSDIDVAELIHSLHDITGPSSESRDHRQKNIGGMNPGVMDRVVGHGPLDLIIIIASCVEVAIKAGEVAA